MWHGDCVESSGVEWSGCTDIKLWAQANRSAGAIGRYWVFLIVTRSRMSECAVDPVPKRCMP